MEYERALRISLERTRPHKYFLANNGFYWNPETGEISLDPGKNVPQSMQLPMRDCNCKVIKTTELFKIIAAASSARHGVVTKHSNKTQR